MEFFKFAYFVPKTAYKIVSSFISDLALIVLVVAVCCAQNLTQSNIMKDLFEVQGARFIHDLRYATTDNFLGVNLYEKFGLDKCFLHKDLQTRMGKLSEILDRENLKIVLYDCFRPSSAQKEAWEKLNDERFVANPYKNGSNHSRAIALDVGLADENGKILEMPSAFDEFNKKAFSKYQCPKGEVQKCANRELLKGIMIEAGFKGIGSEWWHYEADFSRDLHRYLAPHLHSNPHHNLNPPSKSQICEKYPLRDFD